MAVDEKVRNFPVLDESVNKRHEVNTHAAGESKQNYDKVMQEMLQQLDKVEIRLFEQQQEASYRRQVDLVEKWGKHQAEFWEEVKLERGEAKLEGRESMARQDLFATRLLERKMVLDKLLRRANGRMASSRQVAGEDIIHSCSWIALFYFSSAERIALFQVNF